MKGLYVDENGNASLDIPEMLQQMSLPDTEANRDLAVEVATRVFRELNVITEKTVVSHNHKHRCVRCRTDWLHNGKKANCIQPKYAQCPNCKN